MAQVSAYAAVPADVDPVTAEVPLGGYVCRADQVSFDADKPVTTLTVRNTGDRPVQVGSHFHFFEANRALDFDRPAAFGLHLNIPSSTTASTTWLTDRPPARTLPGGRPKRWRLRPSAASARPHSADRSR
jgi:hypothetical protein